MFSEQPSSFELLLARCSDTVEMRSVHIVEDAITYARWILRDGKAMLANLTETQKRCTELILENRALKSKIDDLQRR